MVYFISDLHFRHLKLIQNYRGFKDIGSHDDMIIHNWNKVVSKRDKVYLLGDLSMQKDVSDLLVQLNGMIMIISGNHDKANHLKKYLELPNIQGVAGIVKYKGFWLTHAPIHSSELRGARNIHGHLHGNVVKKSFGLIRDKRYINVCVDLNDFTPISFDSIKNR